MKSSLQRSPCCLRIRNACSLSPQNCMRFIEATCVSVLSAAPLKRKRAWGSRDASRSSKAACSSSMRRAWAAAPLAAVSLSASAAPAVATKAAAGAALPALIQSLGVFILCCAAAAFLLASIPALLAAARAAHRAESVFRVVEAELPDTAASVRLSGLELSDCLGELGALGNDLTGGVRASARMLSAAEQGIKAAPGVVANTVVPAIARVESKARNKLEELLLERANTHPDLLPQLRGALRGTAAFARRARLGLQAVDLVAQVALRAGAAVRGALDGRALAVARASVAAAGAAQVQAGGGGGSSNGEAGYLPSRADAKQQQQQQQQPPPGSQRWQAQQQQQQQVVQRPSRAPQQAGAQQQQQQRQQQQQQVKQQERAGQQQPVPPQAPSSLNGRGVKGKKGGPAGAA